MRTPTQSRKLGTTHWIVFNVTVISVLLVIVATGLQLLFQYYDGKRDMKTAAERLWRSYEPTFITSM